jgi:hypothetical protein
MTLEQFKKDILGDSIINFSEEEIVSLYTIAFSFAEFAIHKFKKEKVSLDIEHIVQ